MSGSFVKHIPRTFFLGEQTVTYNEYRGPRAPSATLGAIGDIFVDFKAPALYARYVAGWTLWPGPQARNAALAHPAYPDHFLWASTVRSRVLWAPKMKMKKAVASAAEILTQIIEADGRRDSKLKRKMPEAPAGAGDAKKPRVSELVPPEPARAGPAPSSTAESSALVASGPETPAKPPETPSKAKAPPVIRLKEPIPQHVMPSAEPAIPIIQPLVPSVASTSGTKPSASANTITPATKLPAPPVTSSTQPSLAVVPSATPATRRPAPPTASSTKSSATPATKLPAPPIASSTKPSVSVVPSITPATKPPAPPTTSRTKPPTTTSAVKASAPRTKSESSITNAGTSPATSSAKPSAPPLKRPAPGASNESRKRQRVQQPTLAADDCSSMDEAAMKEKMRPVSKQLKYLRGHGDSQIQLFTENLIVIGKHIDGLLKKTEAVGEDRGKTGESIGHFWAYVAYFWPKSIKGSWLREVYEKSVLQLNSEAGPESLSTKPTVVPEPKASPRPPESEVAVGPTAPIAPPPALPALPALFAHLKRQTQVLKSTSARDPSSPASFTPAASSTPLRSTVPPLPPPASGVKGTAAAAEPPLPQVSISQPRRSEGRSVANGSSVDLLASTSEQSEAIRAEEPLIAALRERYAKCRSEAASQRQTNCLWVAEASASGALIAALTAGREARNAENAALKAENDTLKAENDALKPENRRLRGASEGIEPETAEICQREKEAVVGGEDVIEDAPMPDVFKVKQEVAVLHMPRARIDPPADGHSGSAKANKTQSSVEVIDLTLDSDDEEEETSASTLPPPSASKAAALAAVVAASGAPVDDPMPAGSGRAGNSPEMGDGDGTELVPDDSVPIGPPIADLPSMDVPQPSTPPRVYIDVDLDSPGSAAQSPPPAPSTGSLVEPSPSAPGHFRIAGSDFDYSDERLRKIVLESDIATRTWGGILAHLQLTAADHQRDVFVKEQWAETVEALQGYYARYLVPRKDTATGFPAEAVPVVDGRDGLDGVSTRVTAGAPVKGNCPTADPGEVTPRTQTPSRDTSSDAFRGRSASTVVPLVDPSTCKNTPPRTKVKIEEGVVDAPSSQRRLSQIHIELLFPHINGSLVCGPCMIDQVDYKREYPTPFHELLAHVEAQHPDAVADILNQTVGMNSDQLHEWFAALDADE